MKVLALSSSRVGNSGFLEKAADTIAEFIGERKLNIAFIPFASVQKDYGEYGAMVKTALNKLPCTIATATPENAKAVIEQAEVIMVGGGNTFKLLHNVYDLNLFNQIREKVKNGTPYIGWSAGANISGRSISTTNDMPIIQPKSFMALGFFPFQINPHYINQAVEGHNGETRDQRLEEFVLLNPAVPVVGLPEGTALQLNGSMLRFTGAADGVLFKCGKNQLPEKTFIQKDSDISWLL
jgi:dipeptidase E